MAVFLKLDGIEGESRDVRHAKEIDVTSWSLGVTNAGSGHGGGGGGAGRATFTDLSVSKLVDKASPALMLAVANGRHVRSGRLTVTSVGGPRPVEYLVVDLEDVLVTACLLADAVGPRPARGERRAGASERSTSPTPSSPRPGGSGRSPSSPGTWSTTRPAEPVRCPLRRTLASATRWRWTRHTVSPVTGSPSPPGPARSAGPRWWPTTGAVLTTTSRRPSFACRSPDGSFHLGPVLAPALHVRRRLRRGLARGRDPRDGLGGRQGARASVAAPGFRRPGGVPRRAARRLGADAGPMNRG